MLTRKQYETAPLHRPAPEGSWRTALLRRDEGCFGPAFPSLAFIVLITALEERGFIRRLPNRARAIEVIKLPELSTAVPASGRRGFTPSVIEGNLGKSRPCACSQRG